MDCVSLDIFSWWNVQQKCVSAQPSVLVVSLNTRTNLPQTKSNFKSLFSETAFHFVWFFATTGDCFMCAPAFLFVSTQLRASSFVLRKLVMKELQDQPAANGKREYKLVTGFRKFLDPFVSNQTDSRAITRMATLRDC